MDAGRGKGDGPLRGPEQERAECCVERAGPWAGEKGEVGNGLRSTEPGAGLPARPRGLGRGAGMDRGWAQVAGWAAVGFGVCWVFFFSILFLFYF